MDDARPFLEHHCVGAVDHRLRRGRGEAGLGAAGRALVGLVGLVGHRRQCWRRSCPAPWMVNCSELALPWASVALAVMAWAPMANVSPEWTTLVPLLENHGIGAVDHVRRVSQRSWRGRRRRWWPRRSGWSTAVMLAAVVSRTVMVNCSELVLPWEIGWRWRRWCGCQRQMCRRNGRRSSPP